jgi:hypothetical protein
MTMVRTTDDVCRPVALLGDADGDDLAPGQLGVLMSRAGVGKSTCLVQLGLNHLVRGESILHLALGDSLAQVEASYSVQLDARLTERDPLDRALLHAELSRQRLIVAHPEPRDAAGHLERALRVARDGMQMEPAAILVDGFEWEADGDQVRAELDSLRGAAAEAGAALWLTGTTHRHETGAHPTEMPPECGSYTDRIDLGVFLEPLGKQIAVRVLHDVRGDGTTAERTLLDSSELRPLTPDEMAPATRSPKRHTLVSGGAPGAEATFGACAEEWGLAERTYSFAGREVARSRGLVELSEAQLRRGDVSRAYITARMGRTYSDDPALSKVLQSLWHQVTRAGEVFAVGAIQPEDTVRGGTGWAVELARHWGKPVYVFDQPAGAWRTWDGEQWVELEVEPTISEHRFCGTGTRQLDESGRRAIRELFQASFGKPRA